MVNWLEKAVFYEIYPQSFQDSNADGIGDFNGIARRLDYIQSLGCNAIWMNPCFESPFQDAGYDISDFYKAAPRYGTNEDLRRLFLEVHKRGMRLILDLVIGHTSIQHKWFTESCKAEQNEYSDRYVWTNDVWYNEPTDNIRGWLRGLSEREGACATNFFTCQPALNYGFSELSAPWQDAADSDAAEHTRLAMQDVMDFWLGLGCDGFRVDMAGSVVKADPGRRGTIAFWQKMRKFMDEKYPDAALISEWGEPHQSLEAGFHMDFLLHFGESHYMDLFRTDTPYFSRKGNGSIGEFVRRYQAYYNATNQKGLICIPSGNHDMVRMRKFLDVEEMKLAFAFLMTMPGAPFIYYGDEIAMRYVEGLPSKEGGFHRTGSRTPMQWDNSTNAGFSSAPACDLYLPQDSTPDRPTMQQATQNPDSIYQFIHELIHLRRKHPALCASGKIEFLYAEDNAYPFVYQRNSGSETIVVLLNPSGTAATCPLDLKLGEVLLSYNGTAAAESGAITVPAESVTVALV